MYLPDHFNKKDPKFALQIIEHFPFGDFIVTKNGNLEVNHLPFLLSEDQSYLLTHVAKKNPLWESLANCDDLLLCFHGPDAYISPSWFSDSQNVPTWNYVSIQVKGKAELLSQTDTLSLIDKLSQKHEAQFDKPWTLDKLSEKKLQAMLKAIVGIKISIDSIQTKAKLSQNKSETQLDELVKGLEAQSDSYSHAIAEFMKVEARHKL